MTRINTINPSELTNEWLLAEYRELPRIPNTIISGKAKVNLSKIPVSYRLGAGHVTFFYNKLKFLKDRHDAILVEMDKRGIKRNTDIVVDISTIPTELCNDWQPSFGDKVLNVSRLKERFVLRKKPYHYTENGVKVVIDDIQEFNSLYKNYSLFLK